MKTSDMLIKAGNIYIEAGKKIAEAEKLLAMIGNVSMPANEGKKQKKTKTKTTKTKTKSKNVKAEAKGLEVIDKLNDLMQKTEKLAEKAGQISKDLI